MPCQSISPAHSKLLEAAGLTTNLLQLIDQRVVMKVDFDGEPYRAAWPSSRMHVEGRISGLTFETLPDGRDGLCLHVKPGDARTPLRAWFADGAWLWSQDGTCLMGRITSLFPIAMEFPDDPLVLAGGIVRSTCPKWHGTLRRFLSSGDAPAEYQDHLAACESCRQAIDNLFAFQVDGLDTNQIPWPPDPNA